MSRLAMAFVTALCVVSSSTAGLSTTKDRPGLGKSPRPRAAKKEAGKKDASARGLSDDFVISKTTEVKLDGCPCSFQDVPSTASIILLEVAAHDRTAVLRVHFRTNK